jgi:hypothetical protein
MAVSLCFESVYPYLEAIFSINSALLARNPACRPPARRAVFISAGFLYDRKTAHWGHPAHLSSSASIRPDRRIGLWDNIASPEPTIKSISEGSVLGRNSPVGKAGNEYQAMNTMYPPDQSQMQGFWLKGCPGGKNFIGPLGEAGDTDDREITSFDGRVMVPRFVDADVAGCFGTGVHVRRAASVSAPTGGLARRYFAEASCCTTALLPERRNRRRHPAPPRLG